MTGDEKPRQTSPGGIPDPDFGMTWKISPDLLSIINRDGYFEQTNPAWAATLEWTADDLRSWTFFEFLHPDDLERTRVAFEGIKQGTPVLRFENRYRHKGGGHRWLSWVAVPEGDKFHCSARDVTEEKERAEALAQRTSERDEIWRVSQDMLLIIDTQGVIRAVNDAWTLTLGYSRDDLVGSRFDVFVHPADIAPSYEALAHASSAVLPRFENRYRHKDGSWRVLAWTAAPGREFIYCVARDVTQDKALEREFAQIQERLRQSQKMEAVGQLTGGVAHDFNNLLTVIRSSCHLLKRPDLDEARRIRYVAAISNTVDRAAKLTAQLLAFARRQTLIPEVFAACDSVRSLTDMMATLTGAHIRINTDLPAVPCFVNADASQFDTVLVNLVVNARDAMGDVGDITIKVRGVEQIPAIRGLESRDGPYVAVALTDGGCGIPPELIERIFEPFFTTKAPGKGTGLGLSQVFGFVKQSGGEIDVQSKLDEGTTFTLYLPRVAAPETVLSVAEPEQLIDGQGLRVLVVEDNIEVGTMTAQSLSDLGYVTVLAVDAQAALAELQKDAGRFDVVFSDVMMPGMNGIELGQEIRRLYHDLPVVLTSGYSHVLAQNGTYGFELLHKPYTIELLSQMLGKAAKWQRRWSLVKR